MKNYNKTVRSNNTWEEEVLNQKNREQEMLQKSKVSKLMNKLVFGLFFVAFISCKMASQQEIHIANLKKSFIVQDESQFLNQFPKDFSRFNNYFGWDTVKDVPEELYKEANVYIDHWFNLLQNVAYQEHEQTIIKICADGKWKPDAVNYFQDKSLNYIKEKHRYALINVLEDTKAKSVLFFLFDGPHPQFDADFASNLNVSKRGILNGLFETDFSDKDKVENLGDISFYTNNKAYFSKDIDINNDNVLDKVVSSKPYEGNELLLFVSAKNTYELALKTINFSQDGGNQIVDVIAHETGLTVVTAFPDGGFFESHHAIAFVDDRWLLTNTIYKTKSGDQEDSFIYVCNVTQGIDMGKVELLYNLKSMPEKPDRGKMCSKEENSNSIDSEVANKHVVQSATVDKVSTGEMKYFIEEKLPTIYDYYKKEEVDEVAIWSNKMFGRCCSEADLEYSELLQFHITASTENTKYPSDNLSDKQYRTAYVFKESQHPEIHLELIGVEQHKYHTNLLVDEVLKPNDTLLKPFKLSLVNGYVKSQKTFKENGRVKELEVLLNNTHQGTVELQDTPLIQQFQMDFTFSKNDEVTLIPISFYRGTTYDDICISEIQSSLAQITHPNINKKYKVKDLHKAGSLMKKGEK